MTTVFADTAYYIALLNPHDECCRPAYDYTAGFAGAFVTTAWVLTEVANHLAHATNRPLFLSLLADLRSDDRVEIVPPTAGLFAEGVALYAQRPDKNWSLTDCISFLVMEAHGLTEALTSDHHFAQAGFKVLLARG